uniref:DUF6534 domain-containing protein n=1 Tax=Kwoniella bestiolae CBS 10118 TaxID=1296100 RepID=A0A1B9G7N5_9TREE|nr:hypothetical protein I302_01846 [Kwoniella bestiolae CBS 10118]OCF27011.1 hypothetical protein I302_01846 [Kwoniella bestiolae CBS 10118]
MAMQPPYNETAFLEHLETEARSLYQSHQGLAFGPYVFGYAADGFAFGLLGLQVLQWYTMSYATERRMIRILVWWTFCVSTAYTILTARYMLNLFAFGFDVYRNFFNLSWVTTFFLLDAVIQTPITAFFAHRAHILLGRPRWFTMIMVPLLLLTFSTCFALKIKAPRIAIDRLSERSRLTTSLSLSWLTLTVFQDLVVSGAICWSLLCKKSLVKAFEETDGWMKKLVIVFLEAQAAPTIFSCGFLIAFAAKPQWNLSAFFLCTPKVYAVSLLGILNARYFLKRDLAPQGVFQINRPKFPRLSSYKSAFTVKIHYPNSPQPGSDRYRAANATQTEIRVETETIQEVNKHT